MLVRKDTRIKATCKEHAVNYQQCWQSGNRPTLWEGGIIGMNTGVSSFKRLGAVAGDAGSSPALLSEIVNLKLYYYGNYYWYLF